MASTIYHVLLVVAYVTLCNCVNWNGPSLTTAPGRIAADVTQLPKQVIRRQTSPMSICGFESGQAQSTIACNAGSACGVSALSALSGPSLVQDCCATASSPGAASCLFYTGCADFSAPVTSIPNILTCTSNAPYCQSFTYPEANAIGYGCDTTSDTTWRTVFLTSSSPIGLPSSTPPASKSESISTSPLSSELTPTQSTLKTGQPTLTSSPNSTPGSSSSSIQDLTPAQKAGIGTGCGCAFLFVTFGVILRIRKRNPEMNIQPPEGFDEKSPADKVVEVQGQESAMEEISSQ